MTEYTIINSDCLKAMQEMADESIDAIVTDPPYGLAFMGAKWDSFNGPNGKQTTKERQDEGKRYAAENKGAPRYGNSHGKKVTRNEMVAFQEAMTPIFEEALRVSKAGAHMLCFGGTRTFHRLACSLEDAGWEIRDTIMWVYGSGFPKSMDVGKAIDKAAGAERKVTGVRGRSGSKRNCMAGDFTGGEYMNTEPSTDQAKEWDGWGTCLKPAWEPIIVARKPLDGTVANNVLKWGVGALNIDACRIEYEDGGTAATNPLIRELRGCKNNHNPDTNGTSWSVNSNGKTAHANMKGRFPANLVHDGSQMVLDLFPDSKGQQARVAGNEFVPRGDSGSAARFFYCAKASKKDRGEGNDHPTVKPNALMRWLVRLVCPQGGMVLDPFMGSGSTGVACIQEGMRFVGIDMDEHYCEIAGKRIGAEPDTVFAEV